MCKQKCCSPIETDIQKKAITTGAYSNITKKRNQLYIIQNFIKFPMMINIGSRRRDQQAEKHHQRLAVQAGRIT